MDAYGFYCGLQTHDDGRFALFLHSAARNLLHFYLHSTRLTCHMGNSVTEGVPTDAAASASDDEVRMAAAEALLNRLREILQHQFVDWVRDQKFLVKSRDDVDEKHIPSEVQFDSVGENQNTGSNYVGLHISAKQGDEESSYLLNIGLQRNKDEISLKVKRGSQRRPTTFDLLALIGDEEESWAASRNGSELSYSNRKISPNLLEVWFPQSGEKEEGALQIPLQLHHQTAESSRVVAQSESDRGDGWARFEDEGLYVSLPDVVVSRTLEKKTATIDQAAQNAFDVETAEDDWLRVWMSYLLYWVICNVYAKSNSPTKNGLLRENGNVPNGFPALNDYKAKRPVDLDPATVIGSLTKEGLYFPWHVIESACSALNAGKNVIFTGPPGCGKSKLASFLSRQATGRDPLMATASPAWTSGDLIGRYMPSRERDGLEFREGFFLRAIGQNRRTRWLIIDEFNRADVDACFGELFSILAGDAVELPFKKIVHEEEEEEAEKLEPVRIIPGGDDAETDADYLVPEEFRLIGTMNDADRSGLNNLSYALMRRFAIIPVEAPDSETIEKIIERQIETVTKELQLDKYAWDVSERGEERCTLRSIKNEVIALFARSEESSAGKNYPNDSFQNLVSEAVVGVSVVADLLRFVGEGLRAGIDHDKLRKSSVKIQASHSNKRWAENLTLSYLALAVVLQVYPQLEALEVNTGGEKNRLLQAVRHIFASFHQDFDAHDLLMLRVSKSTDGYNLESDVTISEFLFRNLQTRFPHQVEGWRHQLSDYLPDRG